MKKFIIPVLLSTVLASGCAVTAPIGKGGRIGSFEYDDERSKALLATAVVAGAVVLMAAAENRCVERFVNGPDTNGTPQFVGKNNDIPNSNYGKQNARNRC